MSGNIQCKCEQEGGRQRERDSISGAFNQCVPANKAMFDVLWSVGLKISRVPSDRVSTVRMLCPHLDHYSCLAAKYPSPSISARACLVGTLHLSRGGEI